MHELVAQYEGISGRTSWTNRAVDWVATVCKISGHCFYLAGRKGSKVGLQNLFVTGEAITLGFLLHYGYKL